MRVFALILSGWLLWAMAADAAGLRLLKVPADANGPALEVALWTPCDMPATEMSEGPFVYRGVMDCPISGNELPLIVLSPGGGEHPLFHHDTAEALADAGFAVIGVKHPNDAAYSFNYSWLTERPTDVKRLIDYTLAISPVASHVDPHRIGFFGFSRGGYTGLLLAGGVPSYPILMKALHEVSRIFYPEPRAQLSSEPRLRAFVIADPVSVFPDKSNLSKVTAPIQLWSSSLGGAGVTPEKVAMIANDLPMKPEFHLVPNSKHAAFSLVCSPAIAKVAPAPCDDSPGFDRAAFHAGFNSQVLAFFRQHLSTSLNL